MADKMDKALPNEPRRAIDLPSVIPACSSEYPGTFLFFQLSIAVPASPDSIAKK